MKITSLLAPGDPGGLGTRIVNVKTWRLGQITMSTAASAPRIINLQHHLYCVLQHEVSFFVIIFL
jgi:hypothetical protein